MSDLTMTFFMIFMILLVLSGSLILTMIEGLMTCIADLLVGSATWLRQHFNKS